ncbi:uncharacterized protein LOC132760143 [Ruditapes philippinarum]|uniref:uncharacterized protein LOC132760143 n=1 Tax=Ruditapes philippinarum TaxID=129788 RepID=UPI00295B37AF|nr:uncharacterized protein LOC132760143 [Ruditapes philippinarum]
MVDNADGCGGIVYAYSNVTSALRIWHPVGGSNSLIHVDGMGGGTYNQVADEADITLRLFKVFQSVINYCSFATEEPGINTITTLTSLADCCQATYTCNPGYSLISGNLQRFYDYSLNTWNGTSPECQVATSSVNMCSSIDGGINTDVNLTSTNLGCLATYTCLPGYSLVSGDLFRSYDSLQSAWNGTAPECHVLCSNPTSGTNSMYVLSSSQLLIGTLATYICTSTYVYEAGDYSRVCYGSGSWTGFPLNCSAAVTTTTILPPSTTSTGSVCFNFSTVVNITTVLRIADEIVANLTVPTKTTSKYTRSLTSAKDGRQSSTVIGLAGAGICAVIMGLLFVPDALTVLSFLVNKICSKRDIAD